jgi:hypothetical protein
LAVRSLTLARDLAVDLHGDRPGALARAAGAIASGGLNLEGFAEVEGVLHLIASEPAPARHALEAVGLRVVGERDVLVIQAENRPGVAAEIFGTLAHAKVGVIYTYTASGDRIVIAAEEPARVRALLQQPSSGAAS